MLKLFYRASFSLLNIYCKGVLYVYFEGITFFVRRLLWDIAGRNFYLLGLDSYHPTSFSHPNKINFSYISDRGPQTHQVIVQNQNSAW